ncbi:hypothetical protein AQEC111735_12085 [Aquirufa ecclesiirivi]
MKAVPLVCGLAKLATNLFNVAAETTTLKRSAPEVVTPPCVATRSAVSALYNFTKAVPTPLLKVTTVAVPKLISARSLSLAVAAVVGLVELFAPEKTIDLSPVYPVAVFPLASLAVMVTVWLPPAVCVPVPVTMNFVAAPGFTVMLELVTAVPETGVKVNVPAAEVPVKVKPRLVKFATPLVKSAALFNILVPDKPVIAPVKLVVTVILFPEALKLVTVFPYASSAVKVFVPVKAEPFICGLVKLTANLVNVDSETVTDKRSPPTAKIVPSVAAIVADSALYNTMDVVATPLVKVKLVAVPSSFPPIVGAVAGLAELFAPENVML